MDKVKRLFNGYLLILVGIGLFISLHLILPLELTKTISDNFNKIAIGLAAIITAYFGSSYFSEEISRKRSIGFYRKKYPYENYNKTYKIIASKNDPGAVFLLDLETLHKHHIWNMKTMYDLGWQTHERELLDKKNFDSYLIGDPIRTRGELGE